MSEVKSIIWLRVDAMGDAILSSSMLPYIKEKFSDAKITVVCQEHVRNLYEACPVINSVIASPSEYGSNWGSEVQHNKLLNKIRVKNPDVLLNSVFTTHAMSDIKGLEFIPKRYAIRNHGMTAYTDHVPIRKESGKESEKHCDFLRGLGITVDSLMPQIWLANEDKEFASKIFRDFNIAPAKTIVLFTGTRCEIKKYNRCGEALKGICKDFGYDVIAVGMNKEYGANQNCLNVIGGGINLSGKLTLRQIAAIIEGCSLTIGPDTGFSHMACAVGTPNIVMFGGEYGYRFFPYCELTTLVSIFNKDGSINKNVKDIPPGMIEAKMKKVLGI